jgi:hypothetical protein
MTVRIEPRHLVRQEILDERRNRHAPVCGDLDRSPRGGGAGFKTADSTGFSRWPQLEFLRKFLLLAAINRY